MKRSILALSFLVVVCFSGCGLQQAMLSKLWFFSYTTGSGVSKYTMETYSFIYFHSDGTFTADIGKFMHGKWDISGGNINLRSDNGSVYTLTMKTLTMAQLQVAAPTVPAIVYTFIPQKTTLKTSTEDPFSQENNKWRFPAKHKESDAELRARLSNHCRFWQKYFDWGIKDNIQVLDVRSLPTPLKIYGNGFVLKSFDDLPDEWKAYFYDEEDCKKASAILEDIFNKKNINWGSLDNRYKMFSGAFQQMQDFLK